jgi:antirestriction protein ArdC
MARQDVKDITAKLEQGVKDIFTSDKYTEYLNFMGKFTNYSFNNCMLIMMQMPQASLVAGYKAWQTKFKRQVRKGEHGITILAPCKYSKEVEDDNGEVTVRSWTSFKTTTVFDISQTDGEEIPTFTSKLTGDVKDFDELFERLTDIAPVPVEHEDIKSGANGYYSNADKRIALANGMSEQQTIKTLVHEISHAILHDNEDGEEKEADRMTREVQAESVAYTVCSALGLDTSDYSFGYIAGWSSGKEAKELSKSMEVIRKTAADLIDRLAA